MVKLRSKNYMINVSESMKKIHKEKLEQLCNHCNIDIKMGKLFLNELKLLETKKKLNLIKKR